MTSPSSFPLAWPANRPRTPAERRKAGQFKRKDHRGWMVAVTLAVALERLDEELRRLGARYVVLSTNVELRLDGRPRSNATKPADPGACVYFQLRNQPFALACDTYSEVEQNLAALAAHIEATRAIERHGVASASETLQAFSALPPPPPGGSIIIGEQANAWHQVLGVAEDAPAEVIEAAYRALARKAHPDSPGGSTAKMQTLNQARDAGLKASK